MEYFEKTSIICNAMMSSRKSKSICNRSLNIETVDVPEVGIWGALSNALQKSNEDRAKNMQKQLQIAFTFRSNYRIVQREVCARRSPHQIFAADRAGISGGVRGEICV